MKVMEKYFAVKVCPVCKEPHKRGPQERSCKWAANTSR